MALQDNMITPSFPEGVTLLVPKGQDVPRLIFAEGLLPFAQQSIDFCNAVSKRILLSRDFRPYPEMLAFAHWLRKASILNLAKDFQETHSDPRQARGMAFHIAPKNVDTIFLYSLFLALLAGNTNVVRISSSQTQQVSQVLNVLNALLSSGEFPDIADRICVIGYDHSTEISSFFSQACALRIVWGGDSTVSAIREIPLPPHARDMGFPNKWSLSVFNAEAVLSADASAMDGLVTAYANDTFWFGQMACSSPRGMLWLGSDSDINEASEKFWTRLEAHVSTMDIDLASVDVMNKRVLEDHAAIQTESSVRLSSGNLVNVIQFKSVADFLVADHCGSGIFYEANLDSLENLAGLMGRKLQTIVSYGIGKDQWDAALRQNVFSGIDRIVNVGEALNFSAKWDGLNLMTEYTRGITVSVL